MRVRYGFMDEPNIMRALALCRVQHFRINLMDTSFYIGREKLRPRGTGFLRWRDRLFMFMNSLALDATEFFRIPPNRAVELGGQIDSRPSRNLSLRRRRAPCSVDVVLL